MALGTIPPWLQPPNFLGAAERGAQLGLEQRREDLLQAQTADRLKLAYEQLGAKERIAAQAVQARQAQAQAALALRQNFLDLAVRNATERERHNRALEGGRGTLSEMDKFDIGDTKKQLGRVQKSLLEDPAWETLGKTYDPKSPEYQSAVAAFNLKQRTADILRAKLRGMGKKAARTGITHNYNKDTGEYTPVDTGSSAATDLLGSDEEEEE